MGVNDVETASPNQSAQSKHGRRVGPPLGPQIDRPNAGRPEAGCHRRGLVWLGLEIRQPGLVALAIEVREQAQDVPLAATDRTAR